MGVVHARHVVRIAADILAGAIDGVDGEAFDRGQRLRQEGPLNQFGAVEILVNDIGLFAEQVTGLLELFDLSVEAGAAVFQLAGELLLFRLEPFLA